MDTRITETKYKGMKSLLLENEVLSTTLVPDLGSKFTSFYSKKTGKEYLYQKVGSLSRQQYDGDYLQSEMCGYDEMFPTVSTFYYDEYPWEGIKIPDHGEVWSRAWNCDEVSDNHVLLSISGVRLPYLLKKKVSLNGNNIVIDYSAENRSDYDMKFIWCGHIMLNAEKGCRHVPPSGISTATTVYSESGRIGEYGNQFSFPEIKISDGSSYNAGILGDTSADDFQKFYFTDNLDQGLYSLSYPETGKLTVKFQADKITAIAGINAEGGSFGVHCAYIEPCTSPFDRPDIAEMHGRLEKLKANSIYEWKIQIELS